jgi:hypothetical protein
MWKYRTVTYSSLTKLPKDMPPQLMPPPIRLPARDSLLLRFALSPRLELFIDMGLGPALTKESRRPMDGSREGPVVMSTSWFFGSGRLET